MTSTAPWSFRRRTGRAASPPTWACYEQIPYEHEHSDSCSDEEEEDEDDNLSDTNSCSEDDEHYEEGMVMHMDVDGDKSEEQPSKQDLLDIKGKGRAVDPAPNTESEPKTRRTGRPHRRAKKERRTYTLRPILTIQKSQGFVWNQDLFVPPYIKDRYIASTSPSNSMGLISSSVSSTTSTLGEYGYEVEVVEIRVTQDDLNDIIP